MAEITLTEKEKAMLMRRRKNQTLSQAATEAGVHRNTYMNREDKGAILCEDFKPTELEIVFIRRKRLGMTQLECALLLGVSRFWFNQMENGNVPYDQLLKFWEN